MSKEIYTHCLKQQDDYWMVYPKDNPTDAAYFDNEQDARNFLPMLNRMFGTTFRLSDSD